jgi:hypothetical protein
MLVPRRRHWRFAFRPPAIVRHAFPGQVQNADLASRFLTAQHSVALRIRDILHRLHRI